MDACLGKKTCILFTYMFICVSSVDPYSTGLAPMLCVRLWVSCQPNDSQTCSAVCVWHISIFPFLFPRNPSATRRIRIMCRTWGLLWRGSHTSSKEGPLSLSLRGAGAVLVPFLSLLIFIPWTTENKGGERKPWHFPIFSLPRGELLIVVTVQKEGEHKATPLAGLCSTDSSTQHPWMFCATQPSPLQTAPWSLIETSSWWHQRGSSAPTHPAFQHPSLQRGSACSLSLL